MHAEELTLAELVDLQEGRFDLHGRRLVLQSSNALAQLRKDLVETLGLDQRGGCSRGTAISGGGRTRRP